MPLCARARGSPCPLRVSPAPLQTLHAEPAHTNGLAAAVSFTGAGVGERRARCVTCVLLAMGGEGPAAAAATTTMGIHTGRAHAAAPPRRRRLTNSRTWMVAPVAYQKGPATPNLKATLADAAQRRGPGPLGHDVGAHEARLDGAPCRVEVLRRLLIAGVLAVQVDRAGSQRRQSLRRRRAAAAHCWSSGKGAPGALPPSIPNFYSAVQQRVEIRSLHRRRFCFPGARRPRRWQLVATALQLPKPPLGLENFRDRTSSLRRSVLPPPCLCRGAGRQAAALSARRAQPETQQRAHPPARTPPHGRG